MSANPVFERGLPANIDAEKFILGSILLDDSRFIDVAGVIVADDFALEKHRRIFQRMCEMRDRGEHIDRVTLANELLRREELQSIDGLGYLISLDDGLPRLSNIESYVRIVREKAILRKLAVFSQHMMNRALVAEEEPLTIIEDSKLKLSHLYDSSADTDAAETPLEIVSGAGGVNQFFAPEKGVPSPWDSVDFVTGGWQKGELILIGARPSMGKTAFLLNVAWEAAFKQKIPTVIYSFEMTQKSLIRRFISYLSGIPYQDIQQMNLSADQRSECRYRLEQINQSALRVIAASGKSIMAIRSHAERLRSKDQAGFIGIDYIGLMRSGVAKAGTNRNQELGEIARTLKNMAMDLEIPVVCLSQLNRALESRTDKRPSMGDLRDSGEIEEHADLIAFLHRPGYYKRDDPSLQRIAELIIAKQRNGDTPLIPMTFDRVCGRFEEMSAEDER